MKRKNDTFVLLREMFYCRIMRRLQFVTKLEEVSLNTANEVLEKFRVKIQFRFLPDFDIHSFQGCLHFAPLERQDKGD